MTATFVAVEPSKNADIEVPVGREVDELEIAANWCGPGARYAASTSRSPKPNAPLMARPR